MTRFLRIFAVFALAAAPAFAQFTGGDTTQGGRSNGGAQIRNQTENVTDTFAGLTFQIQRLVSDPSNKNGIRMIMRVIETEDIGRRVALIQPAASVVDELGNIYYVANSTGVPVCARKDAWDVDAKNCAYYAPNTPVMLTPSQPLPIVFTLLPYENVYSPDLAAMAQTASLTARFAIYSADLKTIKFHDVVINAIELPQGGS